MKKIKHIKIPIAYLINNKIIKIEPDLINIIEAHTKVLIERYKKKPRDRFIEGEEWNWEELKLMIIGQRMFQSVLNQYKIPYILDEPTFEFPEHKSFIWDFLIPNFGSIEIKTIKSGLKYRNLIIPKARWDREVRSVGPPNYVIILKLLNNEIMDKAEIKGWLYGYEIQKLKVGKKGEYPCFYNEGYYCSLNDRIIRSFNELLPKLKACSMKRC